VSQPQALTPKPAEAPAESWKLAGVAAGRRFLLLLLIGLVWIVPAFADKRFLFGLLLWDALVLLGWMIDLLQLPAPTRLLVQRSWAGPLSLTVAQQATITIQNSSTRALRVAVDDDLPTELRYEPAHLEIAVSARSDSASSYTLRPVRRGDVTCGYTFVRYQSALGIAERWARADLRETVRVYPNLKEAERHSIYLLRSRQIELEKRFVHIRGEGREFESLREYQQGDDPRDICWTATARRMKPITRVYETERSQPVWIVVDCGRLMRTRVGDLSKLDSAVNAALSLAQVAIASGDRVGLMAYGRGVRALVPLGRGGSHLRYIIEQLATVREEAPEADHLLAASALMSRQHRRSLIVWLSDLAETAMTPEVVQGAMHMSRQHVVLLVVIGQRDLRARAASRPANRGEMFQAAAAQELIYRRELLLGNVREKGALALEADWRSLSTVVINEYLNVKERSLI
jgi:uncharacterized protein (DUF58 family)